MADKGQDVTIVDGSLDFSGGVNSYAVTTVQSPANPNGLKRNQLAWMDNCTVRGGGVTQRAGWKSNGPFPAGATGLYQGCFMYEPDSEESYLIVAVGGHIWKMDVDDPSSAIDLSSMFTEASNAQEVTGQVVVVARQNSATPAIGTVIAGNNFPPIGAFNTFIAPGTGNTVRIPVNKIYTGPLSPDPAAIFAMYTHTFEVMSSEGWIAIGSAQVPITLPSNIDRYYFCQAEQFLIIQAGDLSTLPLIWDGTVLRRSAGLSGAGIAPTISPSVADYGIDIGNGAAGWTMPATFGSVTINLNPLYLGGVYTGFVGDQLCLLNGIQANNSSVPFRLVNYATVSATLIVTAIGANSITVMNIGSSAPYASGTFIPSSTPIWRLNFITPSPSKGASGGGGTAELPPATAMDYYMGRLWYAQGRQYAAGDIVGNQSSGTFQYNFRDSVLKVTENPLCVGGDGFTVPTNAGNIRAIKHSANINTQLGQGQLFIFTRRSVYSLTVPVSRTDWIGANTNNQPIQTVVQVTNGAVNDRSVAAQNGDLFFQSFEPSIRSLITAVRNFQQWGNVPISINENRILAFNDRGLMQFASGISFSNRMLQTVLPFLSPVGTAFRSLIPLNFDVVSTLETQLPPVWEGMLEGLDILELSTGDFGGRPRAFAAVYSNMNREIQLWEITDSDRFENGDNRVMWYIETPAFTWGDEFALKKMVSAELWIDRIYGEVMFSLDWRPDSDPCWYKWHEWKLCTARDSCEDVHNPQCLYPQIYRESFRQTITLPNPPEICQKVSKRPANVGYQMQVRLTIKGFCRIRGILLKAEKVKQQLYGSDMVC